MAQSQPFTLPGPHFSRLLRVEVGLRESPRDGPLWQRMGPRTQSLPVPLPFPSHRHLHWSQTLGTVFSFLRRRKNLLLCMKIRGLGWTGVGKAGWISSFPLLFNTKWGCSSHPQPPLISSADCLSTYWPRVSVLEFFFNRFWVFFF